MRPVTSTKFSSVPTFAREANSELHGVMLMSPAELVIAEAKHLLLNVALEDRRALSAVGQRFVSNVVWRRSALERELEDRTERPRRRGRTVSHNRRPN